MQPDHTLEALAAATGDLLISLEGDRHTVPSGVAYDSRSVSVGDLFFCIPGERADGHDYARAARAAGAVALCVEHATAVGLPEIVVADARKAMARVAAAWFGRPADDLLLLGVTGTNGKTTTAFLVESILSAAGFTTGLMGTIETRVAGERQPGVRTTPESIDLHRLFDVMRTRGVTAVAMEVTSHGLALHRVEGVRFAAAAFTNLSQDHLDFHSSMEDYFEAKRSLFVEGRAAKGAVNADDPHGRVLAAEASIPCVTFGTGTDADVRASNIEIGPTGSSFTIATPEGDVNVTTSLVGAFNVSNCLAAAATALQAGIDLGYIEKGLAALEAVPGRLERVDCGQPFGVVVDYAHTPDSLDNALKAVRSLVSPDGRILCVFGCGGDRDRAKRPLMGSAAGRLADYVIVTSDNPRSEDPQRIIDEILEGVVAVRADGPDFVSVDRAEAIAHAIGVARPGDAILIAGKGHETGQEFADHVAPFDDRLIAGDALRHAGWGGPK